MNPLSHNPLPPFPNYPCEAVESPLKRKEISPRDHGRHSKGRFDIANHLSAPLGKGNPPQTTNTYNTKTHLPPLSG
jgi:hypothetical protein